MLDESTAHLREIIDDAAVLMSEYFKKTITFSKVVQVSEPDRRNVLLRLLIDKPQERMPKTIILKQNATETNKFIMVPIFRTGSFVLFQTLYLKEDKTTCPKNGDHYSPPQFDV